MVNKNGKPCYRALCLGLLVVLLAGAVPALGQDDISAQLAQLFPHRIQEGFRVGVMGGTCFHADASSQPCPVVQFDLRWIPKDRHSDTARDNIGKAQLLRFTPGYHAGMRHRRVVAADPGQSLAGGQATINSSLDNTWPEPPDPDPDDPGNLPGFLSKTGANTATEITQRKGDHNGTITGLAELVLVMPVQPKFSLTPFAGIGLTHIREGAADSLSNQFAIESKTLFSASYGAEIDVRLNDRLDLRFQFRGIVHFPKTLTYIDAQGQSLTVDVATVSTSSLMVGLGFRLPQ